MLRILAPLDGSAAALRALGTQKGARTGEVSIVVLNVAFRFQQADI